MLRRYWTKQLQNLRAESFRCDQISNAASPRWEHEAVLEKVRDRPTATPLRNGRPGRQDSRASVRHAVKCWMGMVRTFYEGSPEVGNEMEICQTFLTPTTGSA